MKTRIAVGVLSLLMAASLAFAQQPGQGQGRGRGRGGFGFGGGFGAPATLWSLASNEAVQKDLEAKEEQVAKLKAINEDATKEIREAAGSFNFQEVFQLPEEERTKKMAEFREKSEAATKKAVETYKPKIAEVLDEKQMERLQQIAVQALRERAYQDAEVVKTLDVKEDQQKKIAAIIKDAADKRQALMPRGAFGQQGQGNQVNFQEIMTKSREIEENRDKELAAVLTKEQNEKLDKLKGKAFDLAQLRPRGGFGNFGGQRPDGQGRPNPSGRPQPKTDSKEPEKKE